MKTVYNIVQPGCETEKAMLICCGRELLRKKAKIRLPGREGVGCNGSNSWVTLLRLVLWARNAGRGERG